MAHAEIELDPEEWAAALFQGRPPTQFEVAASLAGAIERGRLQEREACAKLADEGGAVCEVYGIRDGTIAAANARLVAAAPELADALDSLMMALDLPGDHCEVENAKMHAKAALAKVRGETK